MCVCNVCQVGEVVRAAGAAGLPGSIEIDLHHLETRQSNVLFLYKTLFKFFLFFVVSILAAHSFSCFLLTFSQDLKVTSKECLLSAMASSAFVRDRYVICKSLSPSSMR